MRRSFTLLLSAAHIVDAEETYSITLFLFQKVQTVAGSVCSRPPGPI